MIRRPRRPRTLRTRLLVTVLVVTAAGLVIFGTLSTVLLGRSQLARIDDQIDHVAIGLASADRPPPPPPNAAEDDALLRPSSRLLFFDLAGTPTDTTGTTLELPPMDAAAVRARGSAPFTVGERDGGGRWRVATVVQPPDRFEPDGGTAAVVMSLDDYSATISELRTIELVTGAVLLGLLGVAAALLVRAGLSPLTRIERTAAAITAGDLGRRVDNVDDHTEVGRLGQAFDVMLNRLSTTMRRLADSDARLRTFVADASHELRTPLTSIRGYAELYRHGTPAPADVERMMHRIESEAVRMAGLVDDMLLLAQLDEERPLDLTEVDLNVLAADVANDARIRKPERVVTLRIPDRPMRTLGDEHRLRQVLTNVVDNALTHTPADAAVDIVVERVTGPPADPIATAGAESAAIGGGLAVRVRDNGPGIPPEQAAHIFDRFYRADKSRSRGGGSGLGLAITTAILAAHGARIDLTAAPGGGAEFAVLFPPAAHPPADEPDPA
ncbi:sensor histidine kinase [Nocardia aurantia]|uniref:histidine kinase n=1 Tax=Nocardia aurantia TaxID=2585199 RepID=A0A7K0DJR0_9NOCA|nr:HAMP domain-containing sensor histidine kinase [Nocardia aurantia]MQY25949.1 putative sensor histidine kinase TcrY [Nocardia aurantia]